MKNPIWGSSITHKQRLVHVSILLSLTIAGPGLMMTFLHWHWTRSVSWAVGVLLASITAKTWRH